MVNHHENYEKPLFGKKNWELFPGVSSKSKSFDMNFTRDPNKPKCLDLKKR